MQPKTRLSLQPSEAQVLAAASRIYAAYVTTRQIQPGTEAQWLDKALGEALHLAQRVDAAIQSDDEIVGGLGAAAQGGGGLRPGGSSGPPIGLRPQ